MICQYQCAEILKEWGYNGYASPELGNISDGTVRKKKSVREHEKTGRSVRPQISAKIKIADGIKDTFVMDLKEYWAVSSMEQYFWIRDKTKISKTTWKNPTFYCKRTPYTHWWLLTLATLL